MIELRKDYLLDRWVILASMRKKRPRDFIRQSAAVASQVCVFCEGNEKLTPPEIGRISSPNGKWSMRWFPNLFPAAEKSGQKDVRTDNIFYTFAASYGSHEILVETPKHDRQLWDFSAAELNQLLHVYTDRIGSLEGRDAKKHGFPIRMAGKLAPLEGVVYVARGATNNAGSIFQLRKMLRSALHAQERKLGFSFVEILTMCPTGWFIQTGEAPDYLEDKLAAYHKPGVIKDVTGEDAP